MKITTAVLSDSYYLPGDNKPVILGVFRQVTLNPVPDANKLRGILYFSVNPETSTLSGASRASVFARKDGIETIFFQTPLTGYDSSQDLNFSIDLSQTLDGAGLTLTAGKYDFFVKLDDNEELFVTDLKAI